MYDCIFMEYAGYSENFAFATNFTALSENARLDNSLFILPLRLKFSFIVILVKSISKNFAKFSIMR